MQHAITRIPLLFMLILLSLTACSPDIEEAVEEEPVEIAELPPEPHWADGIIEIEVGRFQTGKDMLAVLKDSLIGTSESILAMLSKPNFPMSRQRKTISVAVLTLQEIGFTEPATVPEIRRRLKQLGYRPLTLEEVIETRLQFMDQPDRPDEYRFPRNTTPPPPEHDRSPKNRMDAFYALPERNDILNEAGSASNVLFKIARNSYYARAVGTREISIGARPVEKLDPLAPVYDVTKGALGGFTGARIACAITEE